MKKALGTSGTIIKGLTSTSVSMQKEERAGGKIHRYKGWKISKFSERHNPRIHKDK